MALRPAPALLLLLLPAGTAALGPRRQPPGTRPVVHLGVEPDERCPTYQQCGEDCLGNLHHSRDFTPEGRRIIESLDPQTANVWSIGVGGDVSFDLALACKYNLTVHMFEASPAMEEHMAAVNLLLGSMETTHPMTSPMHVACDNCENYWDDVSHTQAATHQLVHHKKAVTKNGSFTFFEAKGGGWTLDPQERNHRRRAANTTVPAVSLASLMEEMDVDRIDVLRIDLDGLERDLVEEIVELPEEKLPRLVFVPLYDYNEMTCKYDDEQICAIRKRLAKKTFKKVRNRNYTFALYHRKDFVFMQGV